MREENKESGKGKPSNKNKGSGALRKKKKVQPYYGPVMPANTVYYDFTKVSEAQV